MSTVDPVALRRANRHDRTTRRAGRPGFLVAAMAGAMVMSACAVVLGLAIACLAEDFRHILVDSVFDHRERMPTYWGAATIGLLWMIGTFGLLVAGPVTWWLIDAYRGGERPLLLLPHRRDLERVRLGRLGADVVVKYADAQGVERWVTRRIRDHATMPGDGRVQVLFDLLQPDRDDLVFVSFHRDPSDRVGRQHGLGPRTGRGRASVHRCNARTPQW